MSLPSLDVQSACLREKLMAKISNGKELAGAPLDRPSSRGGETPIDVVVGRRGRFGR